jgi:signal transduction histidine kinase
VFLRRPQDAAARLLFLFCTLLPTGAVNNNQADLFDSRAYWAEILLNRLDWIFIVTPLLMHLTLVFPVPKPFLHRHGWLVPALLYGLAPGNFLLMLAVSGDWATAFWPAYNILAPLWSSLGLLVMIASVAHSVRTVRDPVPRAQMRWVALGLLVGLVTPSVLYALGPLLDPGSTWIDALGSGVFLALPLSLGIAILRYRLWDIDVLLNRTLVYGALTVSIVGLYVLVVGALGGLLQAAGNPLIALVATGLVAVLFGPLRDRLQRLVNHLLYGQRDEPYAVLSRLGQRLEGTLAPDTVLPTLVETVATALKLPYVGIMLAQEAGEAVAAAHGTPSADPLRVPLVYQGTPVGALLLAPRAPGEAWSRADRRLLADLAHQAGAAVHGVLLARDLQRLMGDLRRSRERLVLAREEERRRMRRDLHDELAPALAALALTASTAGDLIPSDPEAAAELVARLHTALRGAVGDIRRLVYDLRPPVLDELGLVAAIRERAAQYTLQPRAGAGQNGAAGLQVEVEAPESLPPLPAAVEVAAYRIVQEALMNAARHAGAQHCCIRLAVAGDLEVEVLDDGAGIPAGHPVGVGLGSMRERAEELGGRCVIQRRGPAGGTRVWACVPLQGGADGAVTHPHCR